MANQNLQWTLVGIDRLSPAVRAALANIDQLIGRAQRLQQAFMDKGGAQALQVLGKGLEAAGQMADRLLSTVMGVFQRIAGGVLDLAGKITGALVGAFEAALSAAGKIASGIGAALAHAFMLLGKAGVDMNVTLDRATIALTKITGSASGARNVITQLRQESLVSALTFKDLIPIGQQLAAVYGPQGLGKIIPTIRAFGDASAVLGVEQDAQKRALLGFRQLVASPKPQMEDIKQVDENLPGSGVRDILRKKFGTADSEALQSAHITGAQVADAIVEGFNQRFGGGQVQLANTLPIILSNFQDAFNNLAAAVTSKFTPMLSGALSRVLTLVQNLSGNERLISALAVPFDLLGRAIEAAAGQLPAFVDWLTQLLTKENVVNLLADIWGWIQALADRVLQFVNVATGSGGLTTVWDLFQKAATAALDFVLRGWAAFTAGVEYFAKNSDKIWGLIVQGVNLLIAGFQVLVGVVVVALGVKGVGALIGFLGTIGNVINGVKTLVDWIGKIPGLKSLLPGGAAAEAEAGAAAVGGEAAAGAEAAAGGGLAGMLLNPAALIIAGGVTGAYGAAMVKDAREGKQDPGVIATLQHLFPWGQSDEMGPDKAAMARFRQLRAMGLSPRQLAQHGIGGPGQIGGNIPQFDGPLGQLQKLGQDALGFVGGVSVDALQKAIQEVGKVLGGGRAAEEEAWKNNGFDALQRKAGQYAGNARGFLNRALSGGPAGGAPGAPGGGGGGTGGPAAAELMSPAELKKIIETRNAAFDSQIADAKVMAEAPFVGRFISDAERPFVENQKAAEEYNRIVPVLQEKQRDITEQLKRLSPKEKEYWELKQKQAQLQGEIQGYTQKYVDTYEQARNADQQQTLDAINTHAETVNAHLKNDPFLKNNSAAARAYKAKELVPVLMDKFRQLAGMSKTGESEADKNKRLTEMENVRGEILEASGVDGHGQGVLLEGVMAAQNQINRMVLQYRTGRGLRPVNGVAGFDPNTGLIPLFNQKKARSILGQLDQIQREAEVQAQQATINTSGQVVINAGGVANGAPGFVGGGGSEAGGSPNVAIINVGGSGQIAEALRKTGAFTEQQVAQIALNAVRQAKQLAGM